MTFQRISKREAKKRFEAGESITLCPCKLRPGYPWSPHYTVSGKSAREWEEYGKSWRYKSAWDMMYDNWAWYNTSHEAGYYAHYYVEN